MQNQVKIVVFDLDETLGYFVEFGIFWEALNNYFKRKTNSHPLDQIEFNEILDLYPEFIRPDIYTILNYLKTKKEENICESVIIYTNNQCSKKWVYLIKNYFEYKISNKIFDNIICAFKINGRKVELLRRSHEKTYEDLIKCTKIPKNTQICFIDDNYYPNMHSNIIYYIRVKPYIYNLEMGVMVNRFLLSKIGEIMIKNKEKFIDFTNEYHKNMIMKDYKEYQIDKIVTKKIMVHLTEFFDNDVE
jgi:hypothetical protein